MNDWVKAGTKIECINQLEVENPFIPGRPFVVKPGVRKEIIERNGSYVRVGWFQFGDPSGSTDGYIDQLFGDFTYFWKPFEVATPRSREPRPMILPRHPDIPGHEGQLKALGYWATSHDPDADRYATLEDLKLPWPGDFIDKDWDPAEKARVVAYLKTGKMVEGWRGISWCRFNCGEHDMGSTDLGDGTYVWPQGFAHYVEVHNVKPPPEFIEHVRRNT